eukprot:TRINITY_DN8187_c0_g1_i1.p1 TRINITY_DN8187_c0_g1~~TRINITY_DN8187_c0_g1_i1.p1  ORF type:complete len:535 (+),score=69.95 TRINITY_DN8187_c0_g1_i1:28-1605(+)
MATANGMDKDVAADLIRSEKFSDSGPRELLPAAVFACAVALVAFTSRPGGRKSLRSACTWSSDAFVRVRLRTGLATQRACLRWGPCRSKQVVGLTCSSAAIGYWARSVLSVVVIALSEELALDTSQTGTALSSFFYGYVLSNVACIAIIRRVSPRHLLLLAVVGPSLATLVLPTFVDRWGLHGLVVCRVICGLMQGLLFPSVVAIFGTEFMHDESMRTFALSVLGGMAPLGMSVNLLVSPLLMERSSWVLTVKVAAFLGFPWALLWFASPVSREEERPKDEDSEALPSGEACDAEESAVAEVEFDNLSTKETVADTATISAAAIAISVLRKLPFWGIAAGLFAHNWMNYIVMSWLPMYLRVELCISANALALSCLPYIATAIASPVLGKTASYLQRGGMNLWKLRRLLACCGLLLPGVGMLIFPAISARFWPLPLVAVAISLMCSTLVSVSVQATILDIAGPRTSGVVFALANTFGSIPGFWGVRVAGEIQACCGWGSMFASCTVLYIIATITYVSVGTSQRLFD